MKRIALIGCGNLIKAITEGYCQKNAQSQFEFYCYTPSLTRAKSLAENINGHFCSKPEELKDLDIYLLGFKPQQYDEAIKSYLPIIPKGAQIWSVLAGKQLNKIKEDFPDNPVLRIMPNTATKVARGITLYTCADDDRALIEPIFKELFASVSECHFLGDDDEIDKVTGVSASGPAILFDLALNLVQSLTKRGVQQRMAEKIVRQLFLGSSELMQGEVSIDKLKAEVTSKKGVTFEALEVLKKLDVDQAIDRAIEAAYQRSVELRS